MKSDLAYSFAQGSPYECGFVGLTGIPSYSQYERALEELDSIGVKRINVMVDSDYQVKEEVRKARDRYSNLLQHTHNLLKGTIDMEVFLIMPTTPEGKAKLSKELAKFHAEQALKMVQKLPCSTEQKLELIDAVVEHLRSKQ